MRYWVGLLLSSFAVWLLMSAFAQRARVLAARTASAGPVAAPSSLDAFGEIVRPIILVGLAYAALKTSVVYYLLDGQRVLSLFDLGSFLFLLAAYGTWFVLTTKYRAPALAAGSLGEEEASTADGHGPAHPAGTAAGARRRAGVRRVGTGLVAEGQAAARGRAHG